MPLYRNCCLLLATLFAAVATAADLTATADRTVVSADETLQLTVRVDQQVGYGGPDFSTLEQNFDVLNQQRSNQFRSVNGRTEAWTEWAITLAPRRQGKLLIPSFEYEGAYSDAIEITVTEPGLATANGEPRDIFVDVKVDKEELHVQEQLLVAMRLHTLVSLREIDVTEPDIANAIVEKVSEARFRKTLQGKEYLVWEVIYAIYPQKSEALTIPSLNWNLVVANSRSSWFNNPLHSSRGNVRRIRSQAKTVNVKPKPAQFTGLNWIPAKNVSLEQHWSSAPSRFVVGEPITRTITLSAEGLTSSQLPPLPAIDVDGIKVYSDQPQFDDMKSRDGVTGHRIESFAIVPTRAGSMTLPALQVAWWDVQKQQQTVASLPPITINVAPAAATPSAPPPLPAPRTESTPAGANAGEAAELVLTAPALPWIVSTLVSGLLAVIFFLAWIQARRQIPQDRQGESDATAPNTSAREALDQVRRACANSNARAAHNALGQWGKLYWQLPHIASLQEIRHYAGHAELGKQLAELDKILYGNESALERRSAAWNGDPLWRALVDFRRRDKKNKQRTLAHNKRNHLPPLYPA